MLEPLTPLTLQCICKARAYCGKPLCMQLHTVSSKYIVLQASGRHCNRHSWLTIGSCLVSKEVILIMVMQVADSHFARWAADRLTGVTGLHVLPCQSAVNRIAQSNLTAGEVGAPTCCMDRRC